MIFVSAAVEVDIMLKRKLRTLLFAAGLAGLLGFSAIAQILPTETTDSGLGGSNVITGTVMSTNGGRLESRATIRLQTMTRGDRVTSTDDRGNFAFRGLVSGDYTIVIDREKDFEPFTQNVSVLQVRGFPGQTYNLNIRLIPKNTSQGKPVVVDASVANLAERGKDLYSKAQDLAKAGDHKGAIEQFELLTSEFPAFMSGFNDLGVEYLRVNDCVKADRAFQAASKIEPEAFAPLLNRGIALVTLKRFATAESVLDHARKINDQSPPLHYFLGQALANLGRFDEAEKELSSAVSTGGPEMKEAHRILAIIYNSRGDRKRAAVELETYLQLAPHTPDAEQLRKTVEQLKGSDAPNTSASKKN